MGRDFAERFPVARDTFAEADEALGFPISKLIFEGPAEELKLTENTQPAILTTSIATMRVLALHGIEPALPPVTHWASGAPTWPQERTPLPTPYASSGRADEPCNWRFPSARERWPPFLLSARNR